MRPVSPPARISYRYAPPLLVGLLVALCFLPVLGNDFVNWDDLHTFLSNQRYRGLSPSHLKWMFTTLYMGHYQPLSWVSHGLVYTVWGMNPVGYHLVNLLLHVANAVVFYFVIVALLRPVESGRTPSALGMRVAAVVGTLFFAIHPLRVEPVAWATERREVLSAFFLLLTVLTYLRMQREKQSASATASRWLVVSLVCYALSLLSKATGLPLPIVLLALDVYPLGRWTGRSGGRDTGTAVLIEKLPYALLASAAASIAVVGVRQEAARPLAQHGLLQRTMQAAYGLCFYVWKTLVPFRLSPLYLLEQPLDPTAPRYVACALLVSAITAVLVVQRRRYPWALVAWVCYVALVAPVLGFAQSGPQIAADRYTYISCLPWAVLVAAGTYQVWLLRAGRRCGRPLSAAAAVVLTAALAVLGARTHAQVYVWRDSLTLWTHVLQIEPANYFAYNNRARARELADDLDGALADCNRALQLNPQHVEAYYNRGNVRRTKGDLDGALADYNQALQFNPLYSGAYNKRGSLRQARGDLDGALADYNEALRLAPDFANAYANRGDAYQAKGDLRRALDDFNRALSLDPGDADVFYNRGNARKAMGDLDGALADYTAALRLKPQFARAYNNRGNARRLQGDLKGARADYDDAVRLNPRYAYAYYNRGIVRHANGDLEGALADHTRALQLLPAGAPTRAAVERSLATVRQELATGAQHRDSTLPTPP